MNKELLGVIIKRLSSLESLNYLEELQIINKEREIIIKWKYPIIETTSGSNQYKESL